MLCMKFPANREIAHDPMEIVKFSYGICLNRDRVADPLAAGIERP